MLRSPARQFVGSVLPSLLFEQPGPTLDRLVGPDAGAFLAATWQVATEETGGAPSPAPRLVSTTDYDGWRIAVIAVVDPALDDPWAAVLAERGGQGRMFALEPTMIAGGRPGAAVTELHVTGVSTRYGDLAAAPRRDVRLTAGDAVVSQLLDRVQHLLGPPLPPRLLEDSTPPPVHRVSTREIELARTDPIPGRRTETPVPARGAAAAFTPADETVAPAPPPRSPPPWWARVRAPRVALAAVLVAGVLAGIHQVILWTWYIEDAAISFAFARHLAMGEGLVAYPGGERVEGYSNPTWVALMALWQLVGVDGFWSSKLMAIALAFGTAALVWRIAARARPGADATPHLAVALLAGSAQFAIWNASGLENALFSFLLAVGIDRTLAESGDPLSPEGPPRSTFPWSATAFLLLALSRPEGIAYAAVGGFYALVFAIGDGRGLRPVFAWLATFFVPWTAYQAWHAWYFAYFFPSTYYAKMADKQFSPWKWDARGWKQIREWSWALGHGALLPLYFAALGGVRARIGAIVAVLGALLLWPLLDTALGDALPLDEAMVGARVGALAVVALIAPVLAGDRPGARARMLCWSEAAVALAFALWANGDWMKGYRWMSLLVVPSSVLLATGLAELADVVQGALGGRVRERWTVPGWGAVVTGLVAFAVPNLWHTAWFSNHRETGPFQVKKRVEHVQAAAQRLHIDRPRVLDVDQGAHLWWSGFEMMDIAGLVDVPMAQHDYERPFIREYVFEEKKPDFAHVHGGWANTSRIPQQEAWDRDYIEMPGYGGKTLHNGNFVRKDRIVDRGPWAGTPGRAVRFAGPEGVTLDGYELPAADVGQGRKLYLEIGLSFGNRDPDRATAGVIVFLSDAGGVKQSFWIPPGYDWYSPWEWANDERFHGRFSLELDASVPPGTYDLGFVVIGGDGAVRGLDADRQIARDDGTSYVDPALPAGAVSGVAPGLDGAGLSPARLAVGEVRFPGVVTVVTADEADVRSAAEATQAIGAADGGACDEAIALWTRAQRRQTQRPTWMANNAPAPKAAIARCLARRSAAEDPAAAFASLVEARRWDRDDPVVRDLAIAAAEARYTAGLQARAGGDAEAAYAAFRDTLLLDPSRAWARRYAEEARDQRLQIRDGERARP